MNAFLRRVARREWPLGWTDSPRLVLAAALLAYAALALVWMRPMSLAPATVLVVSGGPSGSYLWS